MPVPAHTRENWLTRAHSRTGTTIQSNYSPLFDMDTDTDSILQQPDVALSGESLLFEDVEHVQGLEHARDDRASDMGEKLPVELTANDVKREQPEVQLDTDKNRSARRSASPFPQYIKADSGITSPRAAASSLSMVVQHRNHENVIPNALQSPRSLIPRPVRENSAFANKEESISPPAFRRGKVFPKKDNQHIAVSLTAKGQPRTTKTNSSLDGKPGQPSVLASEIPRGNGTRKYSTPKSMTVGAQGTIENFSHPCTPAGFKRDPGSGTQNHMGSVSGFSSHEDELVVSSSGSNYALGVSSSSATQNIYHPDYSKLNLGHARSIFIEERSVPLVEGPSVHLFGTADEEVRNKLHNYTSILPEGRESSRHVPNAIQNAGEPCHTSQTNRNGANSDQDLVCHLYDTIDRLKHENRQARRSAQSILPYRWQCLHRVTCVDEKGGDEEDFRIFLDEPQHMQGDQGSSHLSGRLPVSNIELYIERHPEIAFLVWKSYTCDNHEPDGRVKRGSRVEASSLEIPAPKESIDVVCEVLEAALHEVYNIDPGSLDEGFLAPYLFVYNGRASQEQAISRLSESGRQQIRVFMDFIKANYDAEYDEADAVFVKGFILPRFVPYLFIPGTIVVQENDGQDVAYMIVKSPVELDPRLDSPSLNTIPTPYAVNTGLTKAAKQKQQQWSVKAWSWSYNGSFQQTETKLVIKCPASHPESKLIQELNVYPLKYADSSLKQRLRERGEKFWACRFRQYVNCNSVNLNAEDSNVRILGLYFILCIWLLICGQIDSRFMVDIATYKKMHPDAAISRSEMRDDIEVGGMALDQPSNKEYLLLMPPKVLGYNMKEKKWG